MQKFVTSGILKLDQEFMMSACDPLWTVKSLNLFLFG